MIIKTHHLQKIGNIWIIIYRQPCKESNSRLLPLNPCFVDIFVIKKYGVFNFKIY